MRPVGLSLPIALPARTRTTTTNLNHPPIKSHSQGVISLREAARLGPEDDLVVPLSLGGEPQHVHLSLRCHVREDRAFLPSSLSAGALLALARERSETAASEH